MRQKDVRSYLHAGVELVRVSGEEKLRVRTTAATATAEIVDDPADRPADGPGDGFYGDEERADPLKGEKP